MPGHQDGAPSEEKEPATHRGRPGPGPGAKSQESGTTTSSAGLRTARTQEKELELELRAFVTLGQGGGGVKKPGFTQSGDTAERTGEIPETGIQIEESVTQKPERGCGLNQARGPTRGNPECRPQTRGNPECRRPQGTGRRGRRTRGNMGRKAQKPDGAWVPGSRETSTVSAKPERKGRLSKILRVDASFHPLNTGFESPPENSATKSSKTALTHSPNYVSRELSF